MVDPFGSLSSSPPRPAAADLSKAPPSSSSLLPAAPTLLQATESEGLLLLIAPLAYLALWILRGACGALVAATWAVILYSRHGPQGQSMAMAGPIWTLIALSLAAIVWRLLYGVVTGEVVVSVFMQLGNLVCTAAWVTSSPPAKRRRSPTSRGRIRMRREDGGDACDYDDAPAAGEDNADQQLGTFLLQPSALILLGLHASPRTSAWVSLACLTVLSRALGLEWWLQRRVAAVLLLLAPTALAYWAAEAWWGDGRTLWCMSASLTVLALDRRWFKDLRESAPLSARPFLPAIRQALPYLTALLLPWAMAIPTRHPWLLPLLSLACALPLLLPPEAWTKAADRRGSSLVLTAIGVLASVALPLPLSSTPLPPLACYFFACFLSTRRPIPAALTLLLLLPLAPLTLPPYLSLAALLFTFLHNSPNATSTGNAYLLLTAVTTASSLLLGGSAAHRTALIVLAGIMLRGRALLLPMHTWLGLSLAISHGLAIDVLHRPAALPACLLLLLPLSHPLQQHPAARASALAAYWAGCLASLFTLLPALLESPWRQAGVALATAGAGSLWLLHRHTPAQLPAKRSAAVTSVMGLALVLVCGGGTAVTRVLPLLLLALLAAVMLLRPLPPQLAARVSPTLLVSLLGCAASGCVLPYLVSDEPLPFTFLRMQASLYVIFFGLASGAIALAVSRGGRCRPYVLCLGGLQLVTLTIAAMQYKAVTTSIPRGPLQDAWLRHHLGVVSGLSGTAHLFLALIAHKQPPRHRSSPASLLVSALWAFLGLALAARCLVPPLQTLLREALVLLSSLVLLVLEPRGGITPPPKTRRLVPCLCAVLSFLALHTLVDIYQHSTLLQPDSRRPSAPLLTYPEVQDLILLAVSIASQASSVRSLWSPPRVKPDLLGLLAWAPPLLLTVMVGHVMHIKAVGAVGLALLVLQSRLLQRSSGFKTI